MKLLKIDNMWINKSLVNGVSIPVFDESADLWWYYVVIGEELVEFHSELKDKAFEEYDKVLKALHEAI